MFVWDIVFISLLVVGLIIYELRRKSNKQVSLSERFDNLTPLSWCVMARAEGRKITETTARVYTPSKMVNGSWVYIEANV